MLQGKNILLGITGGIASYKCAELVRLFIKQGANVKVIMTKSAEDFVTPKTLSVLSKNEVVTNFFDDSHHWNNHVALAEWADIFLVAPLTANTLAKFANGMSDNLLTATYLSSRCKVFLAPAMDLEMYQHVTTVKNLEILKSHHHQIINAQFGELASGLIGEGRMAEPNAIVDFIKNNLKLSLPLYGKSVLVNAGPTYEAIDPVRFIGNRSSGKMGIAIADEFAKQGASVTLVLGPSSHKPIQKSITIISVESAEDMFNACRLNFQHADIAILSAAVSDYKPVMISSKKIKKTKIDFDLKLTKTVDILETLGKTKKNQFLVGFALETENLIEYAKEKLIKKNLDLIIANSAADKGAGFGVDTNKITIIDIISDFLSYYQAPINFYPLLRFNFIHL